MREPRCSSQGLVVTVFADDCMFYRGSCCLTPCAHTRVQTCMRTCGRPSPRASGRGGAASPRRPRWGRTRRRDRAAGRRGGDALQGTSERAAQAGPRDPRGLGRRSGGAAPACAAHTRGWLTPETLARRPQGGAVVAASSGDSPCSGDTGEAPPGLRKGRPGPRRCHIGPVSAGRGEQPAGPCAAASAPQGPGLSRKSRAAGLTCVGRRRVAPSLAAAPSRASTALGPPLAALVLGSCCSPGPSPRGSAGTVSRIPNTPPRPGQRSVHTASTLPGLGYPVRSPPPPPRRPPRTAFLLAALAAPAGGSPSPSPRPQAPPAWLSFEEAACRLGSVLHPRLFHRGLSRHLHPPWP